MSRLIITAFFIVCLAFAGSLSAELPSKATYLFYIQGGYAGKCDIVFGEDGDLLVFESTTVVDWDDYKLNLTSRTKIEKETLRPRSFEYKGVRLGQEISGTVWVNGDSISANNAVDGDNFPSGGRMVGPTYFFENYVSDHQIVIAWAMDKANEPFLRFTIFLPSEFMSLASVSTLDSEIELPTSPAPSICKKYAIAMKNSTPYFTYYDPKRRIPVYMDFPSASTEVFLESAYGDKPVAKYERPKEME
jgi:hypothetical protein